MQHRFIIAAMVLLVAPVTALAGAVGGPKTSVAHQPVISAEIEFEADKPAAVGIWLVAPSGIPKATVTVTAPDGKVILKQKISGLGAVSWVPRQRGVYRVKSDHKMHYGSN